MKTVSPLSMLSCAHFPRTFCTKSVSFKTKVPRISAFKEGELRKCAELTMTFARQ